MLYISGSLSGYSKVLEIIVFFNKQMGLILETFVSPIIFMILTINLCMDILRCSYQGAGSQLLIAQGAGHKKIQMLCVESLGIKVSSLYLAEPFGLRQTPHKEMH